MIHVKPDKRSENSANLLMDGLVKCLEEKDFTKISISDLQKASGVSRATFYRLFDTTEDVLAYKCKQLAYDLSQNYAKDENKSNDILLYILRYWFDNYMYIEAIYKCHRPDIFQDALMRITESQNFTFGNYKYDEKFETENEQIRLYKEYILSSVIGSLSSTLMCWIKNGRKETPEELYNIFFQFSNFINNMNESHE